MKGIRIVLALFLIPFENKLKWIVLCLKICSSIDFWILTRLPYKNTLFSAAKTANNEMRTTADVLVEHLFRWDSALICVLTIVLMVLVQRILQRTARWWDRLEDRIELFATHRKRLPHSCNGMDHRYNQIKYGPTTAYLQVLKNSLAAVGAPRAI